MENQFEEVMATNILNLVKETVIQVQEAEFHTKAHYN